MKTILLLFATVTLLTLQCCQSDQRGDTSTERRPESEGSPQVNTEQESVVKMIEQLVGEWDRSGAGQEEDQFQRISFTSDARYILYKGNQKIDSGAYRMNEQLRNLYLESEINKEVKEFEIRLSDNELTMAPKQANGQGGDTQYTYRRR